ncbi:MAG TPA: hypothetical protein VH309_12315 [Elusimicrobiota bacterium]|jgi:hypothetical protein|nr:hypothetical protein [Elusimicrobiota bacterium]
MKPSASAAAAPLAAVLLACLPAAAAPGRDAKLDAEVAGIADLFYGHDFELAAPAAAALEARHPGHPAGPLFEAVVAYQRWTAEGLRDDRAWEAVDRDLSRAIDEANALDKTSPAESNYYLGAALGFRARGLAARRSFLRAVPAAASSLRHLKRALELDPSLTDARLGLGMYDYFAARIPPAAKPFARLLTGEHGDREKGLAELWSVANSTGIARMEARAVLSMILSKNDEADWSGAEKLLAELMERYPRNPLYRLRRTYVAERRGNLNQAAALADPDGKWIPALDPDLRRNARSWAVYRAAEVDLLRGRLDAAARRLAALDERTAPQGLRGWIKLRRANLDDARGRRKEAEALYARIGEKSAQSAAKGFLAAPFPGGPRDVAPFFSGY